MTVISDYLARRDVSTPVDAGLLVLMGSAVLESVEVAAQTWQANCGENAEFSRAIVDRGQRILLMQDPTMQRRTHASFERSFRDLPGTELISFAPVTPWIGPYYVAAAAGGPAIWERERFVSLVLGEVRRLRDDQDGYGPRGRNFIDRVDLPPAVLDAYSNLTRRHPELIRPAGG